jgi:NADPH:quinone reductase-like Zn-dependent oxidoreductase
LGAYAEYLCLPADGALALKPTNLGHEEAAALPFGGTTAWHFLQQVNIQAGQKVLIYGASSAVGASALQIAKYLGAEVTAVCSTANVEWVKHLGADKVIDYTQANWLSQLEQYEVFYEAVNKSPVSLAVSALKPGGSLILSAAMLPEMIQGLWVKLFRKKKVWFGLALETAEGVEFLRKLAEAGQLKPVIDRRFPLAQIADAHAYVDKGHKKGNVVIVVAG